MAKYLNDTSARIELGIGTRPGVPWTRYDADPGEVVEGPAAPGYRDVFVNAGFTLVTPELEAVLAELKAAPVPPVAEEAPTVSGGVEAAFPGEVSEPSEPPKESANGRTKRRPKG